MNRTYNVVSATAMKPLSDDPVSIDTELYVQLGYRTPAAETSDDQPRFARLVLSLSDASRCADIARAFPRSWR